MLALETLTGCYWKLIGRIKPDALECTVTALRNVAVDTTQDCRIVDTGSFDDSTGWHVVLAYLHADGRIERHRPQAEAAADATPNEPSPSRSAA